MLKQSPTFSSIRTPSSYPASRKRYLQDNRGGMRVPYREIALSPTRHSDRIEENPPLPVYDTSGPYTDADVRIELSRGCPAFAPTGSMNDIVPRADGKLVVGATSIESEGYAIRQ